MSNRRRYVAGSLAELEPDELKKGTPAARALALPGNPADAPRYEAAYTRFCSTFPDTFVVSERARVYLDPKKEKENAGRLLSAGFHSMTGYFRDDTPLYELILDDQGQRELDGLWEEFDFITGAPMRQYASFLWFERTDSRFMRGAEFDFARAEDKNAGSETMIKRLAEVYSEKARKNKASDTALLAIKDYFEIISASIRRVEQGRIAAEPSHIEALQTFAERAYRRPLSKPERDRRRRVLSARYAKPTGSITKTPCATRSSACSCRPTFASASICRGPGPASGHCRIMLWPAG